MRVALLCWSPVTVVLADEAPSPESLQQQRAAAEAIKQGGQHLIDAMRSFQEAGRLMWSHNKVPGLRRPLLETLDNVQELLQEWQERLAAPPESPSSPPDGDDTLPSELRLI
ncbi:MAG: hypothetical protein HQL58_03380 [Magnetococcales bacterium]|nr:hypothetical protein [Magnetococcales bacterium]